MNLHDLPPELWICEIIPSLSSFSQFQLKQTSQKLAIWIQQTRRASSIEIADVLSPSMIQWLKLYKFFSIRTLLRRIDFNSEQLLLHLRDKVIDSRTRLDILNFLNIFGGLPLMKDDYFIAWTVRIRDPALFGFAPIRRILNDDVKMERSLQSALEDLIERSEPVDIFRTFVIKVKKSTTAVNLKVLLSKCASESNSAWIKIIVNDMMWAPKIRDDVLTKLQSKTQESGHVL
jgi:hypothetical protein